MKKQLLLGLVLFLAGCQAAGQQAAAVTSSEPVAVLTPPAPSPWAEDRIHAAMEVAKEDLRGGKTLQVVKTLDPLIVAHPDNLDARALRAVAYYQQGLPVIALHDAEAVLAKAPQHPQAIYCRALCRLNGPDPKTSLKDFDLAVKLLPGEMEVRYHRAVALSLVGKNQAALQDLNAVLKALPDFAPAYQQRAMVYHQLHDKKRALADVKMMKKLMLPLHSQAR